MGAVQPEKMPHSQDRLAEKPSARRAVAGPVGQRSGVRHANIPDLINYVLIGRHAVGRVRSYIHHIVTQDNPVRPRHIRIQRKRLRIQLRRGGYIQRINVTRIGHRHIKRIAGQRHVVDEKFALRERNDLGCLREGVQVIDHHFTHIGDKQMGIFNQRPFGT